MFRTCDGEGRRVFLGLHGWGGDHRTFAPLVPFLPADARLYRVDLPGYGRSKPPARWDLESLVAEIVAEVDSIPEERLTIIGNCSGALLGLLAVVRAKHLEVRIERLVLIDPFAYVPWYFRVFVGPSWGRYAYYTAFANPIGRWIANLSLKDHRAEETDLTASFREVDHRVSYAYLRLLCGIDGIAQFAGLRQPIDIVYGERTFSAIRNSVREWQGIWPQARAWKLPRAGHLPIEEATADLARIVFELEP